MEAFEDEFLQAVRDRPPGEGNVGLLECARRLNLSLNTVKRYGRAEADRPHLHPFARGLDLDIQAAAAALTLPHHNGRAREREHQNENDENDKCTAAPASPCSATTSLPAERFWSAH